MSYFLFYNCYTYIWKICLFGNTLTLEIIETTKE